jgi:hypothetical protein
VQNAENSDLLYTDLPGNLKARFIAKSTMYTSDSSVCKLVHDEVIGKRLWLHFVQRNLT